MSFLDKLFSRSTKPGKPVVVDNGNFEDEVIKSDIPVVVDFWSSTCQPCQVMGGLLNEIGPEFAGKVKIAKVRVDYEPEIASQFGVRSVPTLIIFSNGKPVENIVGLLPLMKLKQKFANIIR